MNKVLIVEDNDNFRKMLEMNLDEEGFEYESYSTAEEALDAFNRDLFHAGVFDLKLPGMDGVELLAEIKRVAPDFKIIIITAYGDVDSAVEAVKAGAWDFIQKPFDPEILINKLNLIKKKRESDEWQNVIIGSSDSLQRALEMSKKVASTDTTVLIQGESGTGKELLARAIHRWSPREKNPFVVVNSAAIPETLLESELFGIEGGTATGVERREGKISRADSGTLFLDEIGDMPLVLQSKILRVMEDKSFQKVGGRKDIRVDVRIICATNKELKRMVDNKEFREDLYYRLNVFPVYLPPLRERREDIEPLVIHFISRYSENLGKDITDISDRALLKLQEYEWNGNIRELENVVARAIIISDDGIIDEDCILFDLDSRDGDQSTNFDLIGMGEKARRKTEIRIITEALRKTEGNKAEAARLLNISYKTLFNKINEYGIEK